MPNIEEAKILLFYEKDFIFVCTFAFYKRLIIKYLGVEKLESSLNSLLESREKQKILITSYNQKKCPDVSVLSHISTLTSLKMPMEIERIPLYIQSLQTSLSLF